MWFPPTVWMDYKPRRIDPKREKLLDLHLHPIAVHFPIVVTAASFLVPVIALLIPSIANILFSAITLVANDFTTPSLLLVVFLVILVVNYVIKQEHLKFLKQRFT